MADDYSNNAECKLYNRLSTIDSCIYAGNEAKLIYRYDAVFSPRIMKLILQDLLSITASGSFDDETIQTLLAAATRMCELDGFIPPYNGNLLYAIPILWIAYCTEYKNHGRVHQVNSDIRGLLKNERCAQAVICSEYLNTLFAPPSGKIGILYKYFQQRFGDFHRRRDDDRITAKDELDGLLYVLKYTGFRYVGPDESITLVSDELIRKEWYKQAKKKLSF